MTVTAGRGRNGPWLQNGHVRIETRQDDGTLSFVALTGGFRPAERWHGFVALADGGTASLAAADYDLQPYTDELGAGRRLTLTARDARNGLTMRRTATLYDAHPFAVTQLIVENTGRDEAQLHALDVLTNGARGRGRLQLAARPRDWRIYRNGWQSWSPTMSLGGAQRDMQSRVPELSPEPPQQHAGTFASDDVSVLFDPESGRSLLAGCLTARDFISQVTVDATSRMLHARNLCDGLPLAPGASVSSERFLVDLIGHPNDQLDRYGDALGRVMGARVPATTPTGWCSWYYFFTQVTEDDVIRNLRVLESRRRELPIDAVQIDDGYQADIGDWVAVNEKFPHGMRWLAQQITSAGYTAGLWLAPFLIADTSAMFARHPDFVVRDAAGDPVVATNNWQRRNFGLDGSHPDAQAWLTNLFREVCDDWGYDYVKIDFLYGAALSGRRYDPGATRIRAYRSALDAVRRGVGEHRFILGCGSLMAPSVGYFDANRIGPDVAFYWRRLSAEERARPKPRARTPDDGLSAETAIRNTLTRSWMHGRLWANDPDCVLVRTDRTVLTLDEVRSLVAAIGLSGGMALSSDDLDNVTADRLELLSMVMPVLPSAARPHDLMDRDMPERFELGLDTATGPITLIGLFNFDDEAKDIHLPLPPGRWDAFELWAARYLGVKEGSVSFALVDAHACRVVALRRPSDAPRVVGTDAHVGCGAIDITHERIRGDAMTIGAAPVGRVVRRIVVATAGRAVTAARAGDVDLPFDASGDAVTVEVSAREPVEVELTFA